MIDTRRAALQSHWRHSEQSAGGRHGHRRPRIFLAGFGFTRDAEQECAAFYKRTGRIIKLLTVQEILDKEHVQKM